MEGVALVCSHCGNSLPSGMRFCGYCGTPLPDSAPATPPARPLPEEDRRLVSMLFCDLVGFTPLSEKLDAEEVREIQDAYFGLMSAEIERFGGSVEKYAGDAVLATFGAPVAHEDDPERAIRCALAMHDALVPLAVQVRATRSVDLALRIGINTGEVISGLREGGGRSDYAVTGDAVNTAARFQTAADPGGIMTGEETMRLARRSIRFGERRDLTLKGKLTPVPAYPVLGPREVQAERWEIAASAPHLVGRESELNRLRAAWSAVQAGEARIVVLTGDAGVGKSRLLAEAAGLVAAGAPVWRGRCQSFSEGVSLALIADVIRALVRAGEDGGESAVRAGIEAFADSLLTAGDEESRAITGDVLGELLGLPPAGSILHGADARVRREALVRSLGLLLRARAAMGPVVLVLEDLHWIDEASREVLAVLLPTLRDVPLLVAITQRPSDPLPWQGWAWTETIDLQPLGEDDAAELALSITGAPLSDDLETYLSARTGGNPFFVEELLQSLREAGDLEERDGRLTLAPGAGDRLPSTLREVLLARLDRLERSTRALAQVGSVVGRSFAVRVMAATLGREEKVLEPQLGSLELAALAFSRWSPELEYVFKHALVQEVAYSTLLLKRRRELHAAVGHALASLFRRDEMVETIAYHFSKSDDTAEAAKWLERAGDRAAAIFANQSAVEHFAAGRSALERQGAPSAELARVDEKLSGALTVLARHDEALKARERAAAGYEQAGDRESEARMVAAIGELHDARVRPDEGIARITDFLYQHQGLDAPDALAALHIALSGLLARTSRYEEALQAARYAWKLTEETDDSAGRVRAGIALSFALSDSGQHDAAVPIAEALLPLATEVGDPGLIFRATLMLGGAYEDVGDVSRCAGYFERALALARRMQAPGIIVSALTNLGRVHYRLTEWDRSWEEMEEALAIVRGMGMTARLPFVLYSRGAQAVFLGRWETAESDLEEASTIARSMNDLALFRWAETFAAQGDILRGRPAAARERLEPLLDREGAIESEVTWLLPVLAWAYLEEGKPGLARQTSEAALQRAQAANNQVALADALWVAGRIASHDGQWHDAERFFDEGLDLTRRNHFRWAELRTTFEAGLMEARRGNREQGDALLRGVLAEFRSIGATPYVELAEAALARSDGSKA